MSNENKNKLAYPEKVTLKWLYNHVDLKFWSGLAALVLLVFSAGVTSSKFELVREIYGLQKISNDGLEVLSNQSITEKINRKKEDKESGREAIKVRFLNGNAYVAFSYITIITSENVVSLATKYGSRENAEEILSNAVLGVVFDSLEKLKIDYVRQNRKLVASEILQSTQEAQQRTHLSITSFELLSIDG